MGKLVQITDNKHGILKDIKNDPEMIVAKIRQWVNLKTDEGFTPIHFASFRGNLVLQNKLNSLF